MSSVREHLHRYWFRLAGDVSDLPMGAALGVGVTGVDRDDAEQLIRLALFKDARLPRVVEVVEDVDVRELDHGHVVPNMGDPSRRGVWWPPV